MKIHQLVDCDGLLLVTVITPGYLAPDLTLSSATRRTRHARSDRLFRRGSPVRPRTCPRSG